MRVVITGALGYIGAQVSRHLGNLFPNLELILVDNLVTDRCNALFDLPNNAEFQFHEHDVSTQDLSPFIENSQAVIHLAAFTHIINQVSDQDKIEQTNLAATQNIAKACIKYKVPLLHISTTDVYASKHPKSLDEYCKPTELDPQTPYAAIKLKEEHCLKKLGDTEDLRFITLRLGSIFGISAGMRFQAMLNNLCWQAVLQQAIQLPKAGYDKKHAYLALTDAVNAIGLILKRDLFDNRIYNVLTTNASVHELVDTIKKYCPNMQVKLTGPNTPDPLFYDISYQRIAHLGFEPIGHLEQGIAETIHLIKKSYSIFKKILTRK